MRFFVKLYAMHEDEVAAVSDEIAGDAVEAELHDGMIEGIADEAAIRRLTDKGVVVQVVAPESAGQPVAVGASEPSAPAASGIRAAAAPRAAGPGIAANTGLRVTAGAGTAAAGYWLATLLGGVSDRTLNSLADAGAEVVERDPSGALVLRVEGDPSELASLPFVGQLRPYGERETLEGAVNMLPDTDDALLVGIDMVPGTGDTPSIAADSAPTLARAKAAAPASAASDPVVPASARFEAICHRPQDRAAVRAQIEQLGGTVIGGAGRTVRFILNRADVGLLAADDAVASVTAASTPRLLVDHARLLIGQQWGEPQPGAIPFDGAGEIVGVADTGLDRGHPDFSGKTVVSVALGRPGQTDDPDGHGTHVAGTIVGTGSASLAPGSAAPGPLRGVAPAADLYFQAIMDRNGGLGGLPESLTDLFAPAYTAGVRVHNNSWGAYIQARYDGMSLDVDEFVFDHPDFLPVIAAGNDGSCRPGTQAQPGFVDYPSVGAPATAKNGLTVGASRSDRTAGGMSQLRWSDVWPDDFVAPVGNDNISGEDDRLAAFSSRGPCDDMRIKPDLVAPGTDIAATRSSLAPLANFWGAYPKNRHYAFMGGTSMAAPIVAGCAVLVRQYYRQHRAHADPSAALLKATLINGAHPLTGPDAVAAPPGSPNYHQGFGRIDLGRTLPDPANPAFNLFFIDTWKMHPGLRFTQRSARLRWDLNVKQLGELQIALVWTDPPARSLQNQLRLILDTRKGGQTINWIGNENASAPLKVASHDPRTLLPGQTKVLTRDAHNNAQVIRADVEPGGHTLALFADSLIKLPQDFALVMTFPAGGLDVTGF